MNEHQRIVSKTVDAYRRGLLCVIKNSAERLILHGQAVTETDAATILHRRQTHEQKLLSSFSVLVIETTLTAEEWSSSALPDFVAACEVLALAGQFPTATEWEARQEKLRKERGL